MKTKQYLEGDCLLEIEVSPAASCKNIGRSMISEHIITASITTETRVDKAMTSAHDLAS